MHTHAKREEAVGPPVCVIEWDTCIEHWESYGCLLVMDIAWLLLVILLCLRNYNFQGRVPSPHWMIPYSPEFLLYVAYLESWTVKCGLLWLCLWSKERGDMVTLHSIIPKLGYGGHLVTVLSILLICLLGSQRRQDPHQWVVSSLCWHCLSLSSSLLLAMSLLSVS